MAGLLLAGCRTYGRRDAGEKMLAEMKQATRLYEKDLQRAQAELGLLRQAAAGDSTLQVLAGDYEEVLARQEGVVAENRTIIDRYTDDLGSYRNMHRAYGAMLAEHRRARHQFRSLTYGVLNAGLADSARVPLEAPGRSRRGDRFTKGRYYVAPIFYERLRGQGRPLTMQQALARRQRRPRPGTSRERSGASMDFSIPDPAAPTDTSSGNASTGGEPLS